jgi:gluconolactonase
MARHPALIALSLVFLASATKAEHALFAPGSEWETVMKSENVLEGIAQGPEGSVYVTDVLGDKLIRIDSEGTPTVIDSDTSHANGLATGPDGRLYSVCMEKPLIIAWDMKTGKRENIGIPSSGNDLAITSDGRVFFTQGNDNTVYELNLKTKEAAPAAKMDSPNGITLSADGKALFVGNFKSGKVLSIPILSNKGLGEPSEAFTLKTPKNGQGLPDGMTPLPHGKLLCSTALGLQILSRDAEPEMIANPADKRANYVRLITDKDGKKWIYAAHVTSLIRRAAAIEP